LASIDVNIDESEKVQICLGGLASKFGAFRTAVCTWEATPSFFDLQSMLPVEENHVGAAGGYEIAHRQQDVVYGGKETLWAWRTERVGEPWRQLTKKASERCR
jgi:hypothetical protein